MSHLTTHKVGSNHPPSKGVMQNLDVRRDQPTDANVADDSSEEGEIKEDHPESPQQQGEIRDDHPAGTKRKRSPSNEEQQYSEIDTGPAQNIVSFNSMIFPYERLPCMISINGHEPIGSLYKANQGFAILFFIDPGRFTAPIVTLSFRKSGTETGKDLARNAWDTRSSLGNQWAMTDVVNGYGIVHDSDIRMSNASVLADCSDKDKAKLMYLRFKSWSQVWGFIEKGMYKDLSLPIRRSMKTMFLKSESYQLEIWFIVPFDAPTFRQHCLRYFEDSLAHRQDPLDQWQDQNGVYFNEIPKLPWPSFLNGSGANNPLRMRRQESLPSTTGQDTVTGSGDPSNQAEQSTAEI